MLGLKAHVKTLLFGRKKRPRTIKWGIGKGVIFTIDHQHDGQFFLGLYERELSRSFRRFAPLGGTFCDVGASCGWYSAIVKKRNPQARVIACEPVALLKREFFENMALNDFPRDHFRFVDGMVGSEISLDAILKREPSPVFLKMDIEGWESQALQGARESLQEKIHWLIIETHNAEAERECQTMLHENGFSTRIIKQAWWRIFIPELRPADHNQWLVAEKRDPKMDLGNP